MLFLSLLRVISFARGVSLRGAEDEVLPGDGSAGAESQLGAALEVLNANILSVSSEAAAAQRQLSVDISSLAAVAQHSARVLLSDKIREKQRQLDDAQKEIEHLEEALYSTETECGAKRGCSECTASASCVWCEGERKCVVGSAMGPLGGTCTVYRYKECLRPECRDGVTCSACIVLGCEWCDNGRVCVGREEGLCRASLAVLSVSQCRLSELRDPTQQFTPPPLPSGDAQPSEKFRKLVNLKQSAQFLRQDIALLEEQLETLHIEPQEQRDVEPHLARLGDISSSIESASQTEAAAMLSNAKSALEGLKAEVRRKTITQQAIRRNSAMDSDTLKFV